MWESRVLAAVACLLLMSTGASLQSQPPLVPPEGPLAPPGSALEEIHRPLNVVTRLYKEAKASGAPVRGDFGVRKHFSTALKDKWHLVPSLNTVERLDQLEPGCLVRFRCMVQGHFNAEYYLGQVETADKEPVTTKYRDSIPPLVDKLPDVNDLNVARGMWERLPVKCVEIPGETAWAKADYAALTPQLPARPATDASNPVSPSPRKRQHDGDGAEAEPAGGGAEGPAGAGSGVLHGASPQPRRRFVKGVRSGRGEGEGAGSCAAQDGGGGVRRGAAGSGREEEGTDVKHPEAEFAEAESLR